MLKICSETLQKPEILPKATKQAQNPTNDSKATPKAAKVHQKSPKGGPKASQKVQKDTKNRPDPTQSDQTSPEPDKRVKSYTQSCESSPKVSQRCPQGSQKGPKRI